MEWKEFGELLTALRKESMSLSHARAGNLSRRDVCKRIFRLLEDRSCRVGDEGEHYTEQEIYHTLVDLELGRISHLNERRRHILLALLHVLPLTRMERAELLAMANGIPNQDAMSVGMSREESLRRFKTLLSQMKQPAFVSDSIGNILLANWQIVALYGGDRLLQLYWDMIHQIGGSSSEEALIRLVRIPNVLYLIFAPEVGLYDMFLSDTEEHKKLREDVLVSNVQFYRRTSLPFRTSLRWKRLWTWFTKHAPDGRTRQRFLAYWQKAWKRNDLDGNVHRVYLMRFHPPGETEAVTLRYLAVVSREPVRGDVLYMTLYAPLDATTAEIFSALARTGRDEVVDTRAVVDFLFPVENGNAGPRRR